MIFFIAAREADEETGDREESNDDDVNTSVSTSVSGKSKL